MPFWVVARAIELGNLGAKFPCVAHLGTLWPARHRVQQISEVLKLPIVPELCVDADAELRGGHAVVIHFDDFLNCLNLEKSRNGTRLESFREDLLGEGPACDPGRVEVALQRDLVQDSSRAWGEHASNCGVDDFLQFLVKIGFVLTFGHVLFHF